jgi:hypothetical protein
MRAIALLDRAKVYIGRIIADDVRHWQPVGDDDAPA